MSNPSNYPRQTADPLDRRRRPFTGRHTPIVLAACILFVAAACESDPDCTSVECQTCTITPDMTQSQIQERLIDGGCKGIIFAVGQFNLSATLIIEGKENFKVTGAGKDQTVLSFANQTGGG